MTKKILAIILSVMLCATFCVVSFADDSELDLESIIASEAVQEIIASDGVADITEVVLGIVETYNSVDLQTMGTEKAAQFLQNIIDEVGDELQDGKTNYEAFASDPIDILDRLFDLDIKETIEENVDGEEPENSDSDLQIGMGDVDGDGIITAADARLVLRRAAQLIDFTDEQDRLADVDNDGAVTAADARILLRVSAGLETLD